MGEVIKHKGIEYELPDEKKQNQISWHEWNRPYVIAVDLDGTILQSDTKKWNGPGDFLGTNNDVKRVVEQLDEIPNLWIMIWTCRHTRVKIADLLIERDIPFDSINEHPFEPSDIGRKPPYDALFDDADVFRYDGTNADEFLRFVLEEVIKEE